jgi:CxxC-x17-CxxC domain-containing protein
MAFTDKALRCVECGAEFIWTAGEQAYYQEKQLQHEPRRCRVCKTKRAARPLPSPVRPAKGSAEAVCTACGRPTTVPFKPAPGRPVFCRDCYQHRRTRT